MTSQQSRILPGINLIAFANALPVSPPTVIAPLHIESSIKVTPPIHSTPQNTSDEKIELKSTSVRCDSRFLLAVTNVFAGHSRR